MGMPEVYANSSTPVCNIFSSPLSLNPTIREFAHEDLGGN